MPFANAADALKFLDQNTVTLTDADDGPEQTSAEAIIRAYLSPKIPAIVIATWDISTPVSVPQIIREIAGRLVAAFRYRRLASDDQDAVSQYAQALYTEAMAMLSDIISGKSTIPEVDPTLLTTTDHLTQLHYYPNNASTDPYVPVPNPDGSDGAYKFGMGMIF